ncbi:uncharacterized protein B0H18DRAFT_1125214 [Fomitopsis serialis]|uniref:uncharacterized protein n=1 Tax=Fomitopsis serialis TaxID=139415 RepID=UPI002007E45A|nr:uncharacterized protein B0H18DRAFT_1125214 [Neoantrodia serialis]KAH9914932.1 hypothetical protein B0H18DRAFT_1125214 [Neoantrodia serialis]
MQRKFIESTGNVVFCKDMRDEVVREYSSASPVVHTPVPPRKWHSPPGTRFPASAGGRHIALPSPATHFLDLGPTPPRLFRVLSPPLNVMHLWIAASRAPGESRPTPYHTLSFCL